MAQGTPVLIVIGTAAVLIVAGVAIATRGWRAAALRRLPEASRNLYARSWRGIERRFMESPRAAVGEADRVVVMMLGERGASLDRESSTPDELRLAREAGKTGDTEAMRRAMLHYRRLVDDAVDGASGFADEHRREIAS